MHRRSLSALFASGGRYHQAVSLTLQKSPNWREDILAAQDWCRRRTFDGKRWIHFAKGGQYSPYHSDIHLVVNWERDGEEMREGARHGTLPGARPQNIDMYFMPGLTWPRGQRVALAFTCYRQDVCSATKGRLSS